MKSISLTNGGFATVDDEDYEHIAPFKWTAWKNQAGNWYALRRNKGSPQTVYMHRQIMNFPEFRVDHRDRNGLNNQRNNLRKATASQNGANCKTKSPYLLKGLRADKRRKSWSAQIRHLGVNHHLGTFPTKLDAARAYDAAALKLFGEFACTNHKLGLLPESTCQQS